MQNDIVKQPEPPKAVDSVVAKPASDEKPAAPAEVSAPAATDTEAKEVVHTEESHENTAPAETVKEDQQSGPKNRLNPAIIAAVFVCIVLVVVAVYSGMHKKQPASNKAPAASQQSTQSTSTTELDSAISDANNLPKSSDADDVSSSLSDQALGL